MAGRNELKYYINSASSILLHSRLSLALQTDSHVERDSAYTVRSLYFDDPAGTAFYDKISGFEKRVKYRIRFYNGDLSFLRLEKKEKRGSVCIKTAETLPFDAAQELLSPHPEPMADLSLFSELALKIRTEGFRPLLFVEYRRSAFLHPAGNVRITLDSHITASPYREGLLCGGITLPVLEAGQEVMEIKYDEFMPPFIPPLLADIPKVHAAVSKFCKAREILS